jgi:hypothetical protein
LPTYAWFPTQSATSFSYALISPPSFASIAGSPQKIQIYSTNTANTGTYTIMILTTETNSGLTNSQSFTLQVNCITAITPSPALSAVTYFITNPASTVILTFALTPVGCPNSLVFTVTQADNTVLPSSITYAGGIISIYSSTYSAIGSYSVKVVALDPSTGTTNTQTFSVAIKCTQSIIIAANPIPAITTYVLNPNTLNSVSLTSPTYTPSRCRS